MTSFGAKSHSELVAVPTFRTGGSDMASVRATCPLWSCSSLHAKPTQGQTKDRALRWKRKR